MKRTRPPSGELPAPPLPGAASDLASRGFVVVPLWSPSEALSRRAALLSALFDPAASPEFLPAFLARCRSVYDGTEVPADEHEGHLLRLVLSGLGNMAHAASFHAPVVRAAHGAAYAAIRAAASAAGLVRPGDACHQLADRVTLRQQGTVVLAAVLALGLVLPVVVVVVVLFLFLQPLLPSLPPPLRFRRRGPATTAPLDPGILPLP